MVKNTWSLPLEAMLARYNAVAGVPVPVCLSSQVYKTAEHMITKTTSYDTLCTLVFWALDESPFG